MSFKCPHLKGLESIHNKGDIRNVRLPSVRLLLTPVYVAPADYQTVTRMITFSSSVSTASITVTIFDDSIFESTENFVGNLVDPQSQNRVFLMPSIANVTIMDNDGKPIDFSTINLAISYVSDNGEILRKQINYLF